MKFSDMVCLNETSLVLINEGWDDSFDSVNKGFGEQLHGAVLKRNGPKPRGVRDALTFGYKNQMMPYNRGEQTETNHHTPRKGMKRSKERIIGYVVVNKRKDPRRGRRLWSVPPLLIGAPTPPVPLPSLPARRWLGVVVLFDVLAAAAFVKLVFCRGELTRRGGDVQPR